MKKYFLTGLATLLPLAITIYVIRLIVNLLTRPFMGAMMNLLDAIPIGVGSFLHAEQTIRFASQVCILVLLFLFVLGLGALGRWFVIHRALKLGDKLILKIPVVSKVYKTASELVRTLFSSEQNSFKQVVLVSFPYPGAYCLGLISKEANLEKDDVYVFIPTTPNPTSGFLMVCKKSELIYLDMSNEDAIKYVVSCGVIKPHKKGNQVL